MKLPPFREVSHEIPLIDESKQLKHRLPKCPEVFRSELAQKIERYTTAGWWVPAAAKQATPMLCIPKKNSTLRTVFDLRQQNENTWKDVTPFPDKDAIHHDIVEAYAYMHKVNPNIFPHFLSFYLCITILSLFTHHSNFF